MSQTAPPSGQSWEYHTQRIRRMQRLQVIALALMCLGSIAVAIMFGRVLLSSSAEQRVASAELRALMDARTQILSIENVARRGDIDPESLRRLFAVYVSFRSSLQTMLADQAAGEGAAAARGEVAKSIADLDAAMEPYLRQGLSNIDVPRMIAELGELNLTLGAGLEQWMAFASDRYSSAVRRGEQLASRLFIATITLMSLLGLLAWGWWVLLERARQKMTDSVGDSERRFRSLVQNSSDAVVIVGPDAVIKYAAPPVELMFGRSAAELLHTPLSRLVHPHEQGAMGAIDARGVVALLEDDVILWRGVHADGSTRFLETVATNMLGDPAIGGVVLNTRDVSDRHEAERELAYRANHDPLTDLANRAMFESRLGHLLTSRDVRGFVPAVLILDLDDFKTINDSLGHGAGDQLLVLVAHRVRTCLRSVDLAARFGGDEFAILLEGTRSRGEVEVLAKRLVEVIAEPMMIEGRELEMHASIGIALIEPGSGNSAAALIRDADVAMYVAKDSGRAGYVVFDQSMSARASERLGLIADLRKAVERGEISLNYQPIVSLESHRVIGVEALLRWHHPTRGWVPPTRFVELAEETGQIQHLGGWVLNHALDQMVALDQVVADAEPLHLAVNVSMRQLEQENFAEFVAQSLGRTGFPADRVLVEITETALMRDPDTMLRQLQLLKRLGVTIAIDDFGTGYSSLSYLAHLPIDIVKIDRSFVEGIGNSARDTRIANMIMGIGESLSLKTVAEGVETPAQLAALQDLGCSMVQGFLFGRPMTFTQLRERLSDGVDVDVHAAALQA